MLLLDRQTGATTQPRDGANRPTASAARLQLRLRADGQLVELRTGKTTIGSSPRCNVRIEGSGVQPLHCLITDSAEGPRIRSWAANSKLNGVPFDESALVAGDCLCLGIAELDVIDPLAAVARAQVVESSGAASKDSEQIRVGRDQARSRSRQLLETLRQERTSHQELSQQVAKLQESHLEAIAEQNEINDRLERSLAEAEAARRQLGELDAVETARQELANRNEQLGFEIGELSAQINELTRGQSESEQGQRQLADELAALKEMHQQLADTNAWLQSEIGRLAHEKAASDEQNRQLTEHNSQLQSEVERLSSDHGANNEQYRQLTEANAWLQDEVGQLTTEKAVAYEQCRQMTEQKSHFENQCGRLADEKSALGDQLRQASEVNSRLQNDVLRLANEKAAVDDRHRKLGDEHSRLTKEFGTVTSQRADLEAEREGLQRYIEELRDESRELSGERGSLADERNALCHERSDLRQQIETLRERVAQLDDENSAMAVGKLSLAEERDSLSDEVGELQARVAQLDDENASLAIAKASLAEEQIHLTAEKRRLAELEREMNAAAAGRDRTSAELHRALLQVTELQERDGQHQAVVEAYELLSKEHNQLHDAADKLRDENQRLSDERASVEDAWQALSAEAEGLGDSRQQLAEENAQLLASLNEVRQRLENAHQGQSVFAGSAAELESERDAKQQAEVEGAAEAIAASERRLAEVESRLAEQSIQFESRTREFDAKSQQLTDMIHSLEQQLAAAGKSDDSLTQVREEAQQQLAELEAHRAEQSQRIRELETQLAAAEERAAELAQKVASHSAVVWKEADSEPVARVTEHAVGDVTVANEKPVAPLTFTWSSAREESTSPIEPAPSSAETFGDLPADEAATGSAWGQHSGANAWQSESEGESKAEAVPSPSSVWGQTVEQATSAFDEPMQSDDAIENRPAAKVEPTSFIERYSHLLKEDGPDAEAKPPLPIELPTVRPAANPVQPVVAPVAPSKSDDEDSIEQYMAKLLQRVRGDSAGSAGGASQASQAPPNTPPVKSVGRPFAQSAPLAELPEAGDDGEANLADDQVAEVVEAVKRKTPVQVPAADMNALRALANETARAAISHHELKTLRRNSVTKVIVAALAGMTSLWLMLDSPNWRSMQFMTACGALLVAVFWVGETIRTLTNSQKVRPYGGPEAEAESIAGLGLPIDVEDRS